jgi:hypothetical protein
MVGAKTPVRAVENLHVAEEVVFERMITVPFSDDSLSEPVGQTHVAEAVAAHQPPMLNVRSDDSRMLGQRGLLVAVSAALQPA